MIADLISNPFDPQINALFLVIFNALGIMPAVFAQLLLPASKDQKPVPAAPFVLGSFAGGLFLLGPYLALRQYRPRVDETSLGGLAKATNSKIGGVLTLVSACGLVAYAVQSGALATLPEFLTLFNAQTLVHVSTVDLSLLSLVMWEPMLEDMRRRGAYTDGSGSQKLKLAAFCAIPVLGPAAYVATRPPLLPLDE
ncbi:hypothetical protein JKP88DRAFT_349377 [Tribonema minus]|uniref:Uncharacterized protein n=1 Tax=Tribonema minus TaxID=303371 RepID=A0A836CCP9_9STRA|nr:hypothetical protein JKP88DRAFT_349377 [Tribonema minus]